MLFSDVICHNLYITGLIITSNKYLFYSAASVQAVLVTRNLSVRPSVKCVHCDKTK